MGMFDANVTMYPGVGKGIDIGPQKRSSGSSKIYQAEDLPCKTFKEEKFSISMKPNTLLDMQVHESLENVAPTKARKSNGDINSKSASNGSPTRRN